MANIAPAELRTIITDPNGAELLVRHADLVGRELKETGLTTSQIRALFGEVRQIQGQWGMGGENRQRAARRLILLKPNTTTVDLSVGWLCQPEHVARQLFAGDNDCAEPACASLAATATTPGAVPVNDRVVAARFPTGGALPGRLVRPGKARAPFFLRRFGTDGG